MKRPSSMNPKFLLSRFELVRPPFERSQAELTEWLVRAHAQAAAAVAGQSVPDPRNLERMTKLFARFGGATSERIARRGSETADVLGDDFAQMKTYLITPETPAGVGMSERTQQYAGAVD